jgi:hypothetical protein
MGVAVQEAPGSGDFEIEQVLNGAGITTRADDFFFRVDQFPVKMDLSVPLLQGWDCFAIHRRASRASGLRISPENLIFATMATC